ncbi:MAG: hypothetical protein CBD27_07680 [Rhodospirillaceae bacterium TMED167]|nr:DNA-binding protein [Rhodospirillaceae bacterium]OUW26682.1 MAG: hypothetical protein CBD27_07680 [Rhodospirillaceae bacterium TMED167]
MPWTQEALLNRLTELGIDAPTVQHRPMHTVEEGEEILKDMPGGRCKSLFLKDKKGALWLVVMLGEDRLDTRVLQKDLGSARLSFGKPDLMRSVLGVDPGSVTPFAVINETAKAVQVVLQSRMMEKELLNYHPLRNDATTTLSPSDLLKFISAMGHDPLIMDL